MDVGWQRSVCVNTGESRARTPPAGAREGERREKRKGGEEKLSPDTTGNFILMGTPSTLEAAALGGRLVLSADEVCVT